MEIGEEVGEQIGLDKSCDRASKSRVTFDATRVEVINPHTGRMHNTHESYHTDAYIQEICSGYARKVRQADVD